MQRETKNWLTLIFLACVWGSSFFLMKRGMKFPETGELIYTNLQVGALRMFIAGLVLFPFAFKFRKELLVKKRFLWISIVGLLGNFFPAFLFTYAETELSSGYAGMLNSFVPIFTLLLGYFIFKQKLTKIQLIGVSIGAAGIILLMMSGADLSNSGTWTHKGAIVLATLCYSISLNTIKYKLQGVKPLAVTSLAFGVTLIPSTVLTFLFGAHTTWLMNQHATYGFIHVFILGCVGTALAVIVFNHLIVNSTALFASSVTYFIPIVAVLIGLFIGETITLFQIVAMFIVLSGVYIANYYGKKKQKL
ncbi:MAG: DMT family transporter [Lishizhenia sp.]